MKNLNTKKNPTKPSPDAMRKELFQKRYQQACRQTVPDLLAQLDTTEQGLTEQQIEQSRDKFGDNQVTHEKKKTFWQGLVSSFANPFTAILVFLAIVMSITDIIIPLSKGARQDVDFITVTIILALVIISGVLRFVQEMRSGNAASRLLEMIKTTATVTRMDGGTQEIPLNEIVVGDIIHLSAGDMVPADVRIIKAKDLFVSQSALTGESEPLEKLSDPIKNFSSSYSEAQNLAFMGSNVISGSASAVVVVTGNDTMFGSMAKAVSTEAVVTSFEKGVNAVSWVLIRFMLVMVPIVFLANGITKGDWMQAFLFGVSVAVGLTPEMLPMIITTCLAKGSVAMSRKKTIIKNLNSMQNFGAMDILCTDKTGTLTQDKVVLEYHLDVHGKEDARVLRHGFLNSYYQTGLKNLMDIAIIKKTQEEEEADAQFKDLSSTYEKVDEVPFDFHRRRMSVVVAHKSGKTQMITKGAVEEMLSVCTYAEYQGNIEPLTKSLKAEILKTVDDMNDDGMRVIAVAQKTNPSPVGAFSVKDECDMVLIGYLAFLDPPKETTASAIQTLLEYGVTTKILTGDNDKVTRCICKQVGLSVDHLLLGTDIDKMDDKALRKAVETTNVFAKLSPDQKARIVQMLRENGHTVGFMGDGINDAAAMKASDIGISVDTAVDIAKESADIILLEKDLMVLEDGIIEGRKTYANMIKYIKMTASSNFGNMFSVVVASVLLPFLPMLSVQILFLNLTYNISCTSIPWDNVDAEFLKVPKKWNPSLISSFMIWMGPSSSVFDITTYALMYFIICPRYVSNGVLFHHIPASDTETRALYIAMFQAGWFVESMWSQTLIIHMIRTPKIPFIQSNASFQLTVLTFAGIAFLTAIPFTAIGTMLNLAPLPGEYFAWLTLTIILYMALTTVLKKLYIRRYGELL